MKGLLAATALVAVAWASPASALLSLGPNATTEGLTYTLEAQATANPLTEQFALVIQGVNVAGTDTRLGRTGINGFAFNLVSQNPDSPFTGAVLGTIINGNLSLGTNSFVFKDGGLNSGGCNLTGNFFCFDNTAIGNGGAAPQPTVAITGSTVVIGFEATLLPGGSWANFATDLKIDWVGNQNNYSLVSLAIPVNTTCPDCVINPTLVDAPEPASMALLGVGVLGVLAARRRYR
jgi:hypothetical protein